MRKKPLNVVKKTLAEAKTTTQTKTKGSAKDSDKEQDDKVAKQQEVLDLMLETVEALFAERGEESDIWGSMVKQALKRRNPGFNESYYGFRSFSKLLEEAQNRNLLELEHDERSGGYLIKSFAEIEE